ncbi:hypothetical protein [Flavisericum labens]|uniref:hypothetical protein n=1 Tax=Flavisericum labens TaxID=3377112 RepID=UPI00387AAFEB
MKRQHNPYQLRTGKQSIFRIAQAGRTNLLFDFITGILFSITSYPSYICEIWLRSSFGQRYFTTANALFISLGMIITWLTVGNQGQEFLGFTWLPFMMLFLWKAIRHRMEITKYGTSYNFDRFSLSDGEILPFWWDIIGKEYLGVKITRYRVHILLEPALPVIIGLFLALIPFTRGTGILILISGFMFGFRNFMKAHMARQRVLDAIDEQLIMKWKHDVLVEEKPKSETKGLSLPIELPKSREMREGILEMVDDYNPLDIWDDGIEEEGLGVV